MIQIMLFIITFLLLMFVIAIHIQIEYMFQLNKKIARVNEMLLEEIELIRKEVEK